MTADNELKIFVEIDAHDDVYYKLHQGSMIISDRINGIENLMLLVKGKITEMSK